MCRGTRTARTTSGPRARRNRLMTLWRARNRHAVLRARLSMLVLLPDLLDLLCRVVPDLDAVAQQRVRICAGATDRRGAHGARRRSRSPLALWWRRLMWPPWNMWWRSPLARLMWWRSPLALWWNMRPHAPSARNHHVRHALEKLRPLFTGFCTVLQLGAGCHCSGVQYRRLAL